MLRKIITTLLTILVIAFIAIKAKNLLEERKEEIAKLPTPAALKLAIAVVKGKEGVLTQTLSTLAEVRADQNPAISTKIPGYIEEILPREGQKVKKGSLLVRIDSFELRSNLQALQETLRAQKSDLLVAKKIYERNLKLAKVGGIPKEKLEASRVAVELKSAAVKSTQERIAQLRHQLSYVQIKAPFDGVIEQIILHKGDLAAVGKPILTMDNKTYKLIFSYAPSKEVMIKKGQDVLYRGKKIGKVNRLYPIAKNGLYTAEASLLKELTVPVGSYITIDVIVRQAAGCILPDTTVLHKKDGTYIILYKDGKFIPKKVRILIHEKNYILIKECPKYPVASGSESKLSKLPSYDNVIVVGENNES